MRGGGARSKKSGKNKKKATKQKAFSLFLALSLSFFLLIASSHTWQRLYVNES